MAGKFELRPHSFIVLKDQRESSCKRGALVVSVADGKYQEHSHYATDLSDGKTRIDDSDLIPLTEEECILLDAVFTPSSRYAVYTTPGKLEWGAGLKVGDTVLAQLPNKNVRHSSDSNLDKQKEYATSVIRWISEVGSGRHSFGVEIKVRRICLL